MTAAAVGAVMLRYTWSQKKRIVAVRMFSKNSKIFLTQLKDQRVEVAVSAALSQCHPRVRPKEAEPISPLLHIGLIEHHYLFMIQMDLERRNQGTYLLTVRSTSEAKVTNEKGAPAPPKVLI